MINHAFEQIIHLNIFQDQTRYLHGTKRWQMSMISITKQIAISIEIIQPLSTIQTGLDIGDHRESTYQSALTIRSQGTKIFGTAVAGFGHVPKWNGRNQSVSKWN